MEIISPGIAIFNDVFLRSEEVIEMSEESTNWRAGTAGKETNPEVRITDMHDIDTKHPLHGEILQVFMDGINEYVQTYKACRITKGEHLRIGRYDIGGHYAPHVDSSGSERTLSGVLFLNGDFEGGELNFPDHELSIKPTEGSLVLFPSNYMYVHQSMPITEGRKYITVAWFS